MIEDDAGQSTGPMAGHRIDQPSEPVAASGPARPVTTGHPQVDDVLRTLEVLPGLPVDQHVAVFEAAHVGLRDALGAAPAASGR